MEIKGKIILDLGAVSGTSKAGNNWKKHEYVLETQETYPRRCISTSSATMPTAISST